jgi:16S rRNA (adenine(1408)-N(1))-methyltransferase
VEELSDNLIEKASNSSSPPTGEGIVIDIGTGDGLFVYQCARQNPKKFYIGIDANPRPLEKPSQKIHRNPAKGGLPNVLYIQAAVESLPPELDGVADEVHIHFPWGSLLRAVAIGDEEVLRKLRRLFSPGGVLEVIIGLDPERDRSEIERLGLRPLSAEYIEEELIARYECGGFEVLEAGVMDRSQWPKVKTSWAKRLKGNPGREVAYVIARAADVRS